MKVKFVPQNIEIEVSPEKTLLQSCTENRIDVKSICKGVPSCAECRIRIIEGEHNVMPPTKVELSLIGNSYFLDGRRLSCQIRCFGDITVDFSEQLDRAENQNKKIRGFKSNRTVESQAVQDTMLLSEKKPTTPVK
ncbi:MAG: 2Fe-2S iron-sulfur cluster-binding protein [Bdellovibrionota bacterium]